MELTIRITHKTKTGLYLSYSMPFEGNNIVRLLEDFRNVGYSKDQPSMDTNDLVRIGYELSNHYDHIQGIIRYLGDQ